MVKFHSKYERGENFPVAIKYYNLYNHLTAVSIRDCAECWAVKHDFRHSSVAGDGPGKRILYEVKSNEKPKTACDEFAARPRDVCRPAGWLLQRWKQWE